MGIRLYGLAKKYGVDDAVLIEKLQTLGYKTIKQPSNTIDNKTVEQLIQELSLKERGTASPEPAPTPPAAAKPPTPPAAPWQSRPHHCLPRPAR